MTKNKFLIEKYENLKIDIKMYMSEISESKVSDLKAQKIIILWTLKHVSAISEHPVFLILIMNKPYSLRIKPYSLLNKAKGCQ